MTKIDLNKAKNRCVTEDEDGNCFDISYSEKLYTIILINSWYLSRQDIHILIMNKFK